MDDFEIFYDAKALAEGAAQAFCTSAAKAIASRGRFMVALAGGKTPKAFYELLAKERRYRDGLSWKNIYFFFGDERHVPPDHPDSNFRMVNEALFKNAPVPSENISRILAELADADEAAHRYQERMNEFFATDSVRQDGLPVFDLILLGTGLDGHTASLFQDSEAFTEDEKWVVSNWVAKFASRRITLTFPVLNHAREVLVLVTGRDKAPIIKKIFDRSTDGPRYPIQHVVPLQGRKRWLLDQDTNYLIGKPSELKKPAVMLNVTPT